MKIDEVSFTSNVKPVTSVQCRFCRSVLLIPPVLQHLTLAGRNPCWSGAAPVRAAGLGGCARPLALGVTGCDAVTPVTRTVLAGWSWRPGCCLARDSPKQDLLLKCYFENSWATGWTDILLQVFLNLDSVPVQQQQLMGCSALWNSHLPFGATTNTQSRLQEFVETTLTFLQVLVCIVNLSVLLGQRLAFCILWAMVLHVFQYR